MRNTRALSPNKERRRHKRLISDAIAFKAKTYGKNLAQENNRLRNVIHVVTKRERTKGKSLAKFHTKHCALSKAIC